METIESSRVVASEWTERLVGFLPSLVAALLILGIGFFLASWLAGAAGRGLARSTRLDPTMRAPIVAIVRYLVVVMTLIIALGQVGVQMTSLLAVLGAAGLAVGLALQGTLTNIAAGIMLLWLRPFRVGDYVETATFSGTVREIGLFVSHLESFDGLFVFAPNSTLWNVWLRNHSRAASRVLAWSVTLPRDLAFSQARELLLSAWPATGERAELGGPEVFLDQLTAEAQIVVFRGTVRHGAISRAQHETAERIRTLFVERFGLEGEPKAIQRILPNDGDPSRFMSVAQAPEAHPALVNARVDEPRQDGLRSTVG